MTEVNGATHHQDSTLASLISLSAKSSNLTTPVDLEDPSSSSYAYLLSLTSQSLLDLRNQPAALSTAKTSLNNQLSSLCSQHVPSFVQVHHATSSLPTSLISLETVLENLIERDIQALSDSAQQFTKQVERPLEAKEKAQNLIMQYDLSLKDLLDIPRLLMTCVRANHPVEALSLASHMMRVANQSKHSTVTGSLQLECWTHLKRLREDLLRGLGGRGLRLPAARRYVSLLRNFKEIDASNKAKGENRGKWVDERLSLSDSTICLSFLRSRSMIMGELESKEGGPKSVSSLLAHLSSWRDLVGDTCGMTQSLFSDSIQADDDELEPSALISAFAHQALMTLRKVLSTAIPKILERCSSLQDEIDALSEINTHLSFSAASLSRHGLDISFLQLVEEEESRRTRMAENELRRKKEEEDESRRKKQEEEEIQRRKGEEKEAQLKREAEQKAQRKLEEEQESERRKQAEVKANHQKEAEEEAKRKKAAKEEAERKEKEAEEEAQRIKKEEETQRRKKAEEAQRIKEEEEAQHRKEEEEAQRRKVAEEEAKQREWALQKKAEEEAQQRREAEEVAQRVKQAEEAAEQKREEEEKALQAKEAEEAAQRQKAEEEEAVRIREFEQEDQERKEDEDKDEDKDKDKDKDKANRILKVEQEEEVQRIKFAREDEDNGRRETSEEEEQRISIAKEEEEKKEAMPGDIAAEEKSRGERTLDSDSATLDETSGGDDVRGIETVESTKENEIEANNFAVADGETKSTSDFAATKDQTVLQTEGIKETNDPEVGNMPTTAKAKPQAKNRLAEKLRLRQEEREKAARAGSEAP